MAFPTTALRSAPTVHRLIPILGLVVIIALAWACSEHRRRFPWRTVLWGLGLQFAVAVLVFTPGLGTRTAFLWFNDLVDQVITAAQNGTAFLFGPLAAGPGQPGSVGFILAIQALPIAITVSALSALLYRLGLVQPVVRGFAWIFQRTLGISGAEALTAAANIFVGVESALVVKPYLARMTRAEYLVLLNCGMATAASTVLAIYTMILRPVFPGIAGHLASATLIAIPAAVLVARVLIPETQAAETAGAAPAAMHEEDADTSLTGAVMTGAMDGLKLVAGIAAALIAVLGLLGILELALHAAFTWFKVPDPPTFIDLFSYPFRPLVWLMGVATDDVPTVAHLLAKRLFITELVAYGELAERAGTPGAIHDPRTVVIASYALSGFAHIPSVAIFVGGTAALIPARRNDIAALGWKCLFAATLSTLMIGCIAGIFANGDEVTLTPPPASTGPAPASAPAPATSAPAAPATAVTPTSATAAAR
jgi:CNT family concentrative nucleoside transporter